MVRPSGPAARPLRADARRNHARILQAADAIFAAEGPSASTDEVARRAGVAIGTVFRHFPTKEALLEAVVVERLRSLVEEARSQSSADDPGAAFFAFFAQWVELGATKHALAEALAGAGVVDELHGAVEALLRRAQRAGAVRDDVGVPELVALMIGASRSAQHASRDPHLRARALEIVFDGLRPRP